MKNDKNTNSNILSVIKAKDHVMFTGTAMIPGEPDCDHANGEKIFTEQEVAEFRQSYKNYGIVDDEHTFLMNGKSVGEPVEDFLLPGSTKMTNIHGEERDYPKGTWVVQTKITDPEIMQKAEKGQIAYSPTVIPKDEARKLMAAKGRVLIKEVPDPVVYTLSFTTHPCIDNSCSVKGAAIKSKEDKSVVEKARDMLNNILDGGVDMGEKEKKDEFVTKSDLKDFKEEILEAVKAEPPKEPPKKEPDSGASSGLKCSGCEASIGKPDKFCKKCGAKIGKGSDKSKPDKPPASKSTPNHDDGKQKPAFKSIESYMGRNHRGKPLPQKQK